MRLYAKIIALSIISLNSICFLQAQNKPVENNVIDKENFPFELKNVYASVFVNTEKNRDFNSNQIGLNIDWPAKYYKSMGYNHPDAKKFMRWYKPTNIRWPQGVWANFYDWKVDGRRKYDNFNNREFNTAIINHPNLRYGFPGLYELYKENKFNIVWIWNLNYDSNKKSVERLLDRIDKGFEIKDIELGNEFFWVSQRAERISTPEKIVEISKSLVDTMRKIKPDLRFSIPLSWRRGHDGSNLNHDEYNKFVTRDSSYFDAISLHRYVHYDKDKNPASTDAYRRILTSRLYYMQDVKYLHSLANKPIWLTEWGVGCGDQAASFLAMADLYMYFFDNPEIFEHTCWFQINGANAFLKHTEKGLIKTGFGCVYEIIRDTYLNSKVLETKVISTELVPEVKAVNAQAVWKDGKMYIFAINMSNRDVKLDVNIDNKVYKSKSKVESLCFKKLNEDINLNANDKPFNNTIDYNNSNIILKAYSINRISIID